MRIQENNKACLIIDNETTLSKSVFLLAEYVLKLLFSKKQLEEFCAIHSKAIIITQ